MKQIWSLRHLLVITMTAVALMAHAQNTQLQPNDTIPGMNLRDQHDDAWTIPADSKLVLFSANRDANALIQAILVTKPSDYLQTKKVVYFSDISKMPGFITRTFALPSMRELPYRLGVVMDAKESAAWPRRDGEITAVYLENQRITRIEFISKSTTLAELLERI
jgi:predicted transcriptional regulator